MIDMICVKCNQRTHHAVNRKEGRVCKHCDNMERYEQGEDGFFLCTECGRADSPNNWIGGLLEGLCFNCDFWRGKVKKKDDPRSVRVAGSAYWIGDENASRRGFRGFGGRRFEIEFFDGRKVISTNLWHNGDIPEHFKDRLPDNAEFVPRQRWVDAGKMRCLATVSED